MTKNQICELLPIGPEFPDHRRFDPITAATAAAAGGNLISGFLNHGAAKKAAAAQEVAAKAAGDKVGVATSDANAGIASATQGAQNLATAGGQGVVDAGGRAAAGVNSAAHEANTLLDPYAAAGSDASNTLRSGLAAGGDFNKAPTLADLQMDPGYAFRAQQGELALQRSAAAKGGALGGGAAKDLANYSQGLASQEYQNAFNRFQTSTQNRFSNLFSVSRAGQEAAGTQGANLFGAAKYGGDATIHGADAMLNANEFAGTAGMQGASEIGNNTMKGAMAQGDYLTQGGNAKAAGIVGGANAISAGIAGGTNAITGGVELSQILKNPAIWKGGR